MILNFSYNWNNKLDNKAFTTLRFTDRFKVGDRVEIHLKNKLHSVGEVIGKKEFFIQHINDYIAYLDTGYDKDECIKIIHRMYKNKSIDFDKQKIKLYLIKKIISK